VIPRVDRKAGPAGRTREVKPAAAAVRVSRLFYGNTKKNGRPFGPPWRLLPAHRAARRPLDAQ